MSPGVLYISYDGMLEPLGQSQVLSYLEVLARGRRIHLISFEKAGDWANRANVDVTRRRIWRTRGSGGIPSAITRARAHPRRHMTLRRERRSRSCSRFGIASL